MKKTYFQYAIAMSAVLFFQTVSKAQTWNIPANETLPAANPNYIGNSDAVSDLKISNAGAHDIIFRTGGAERVRILGSGGWPGTVKLVGNNTYLTFGGPVPASTNPGYNNGVINWHNAGNFYFRTLSNVDDNSTYTERMMITSTGSVGIGTTSIMPPTQRFHVAGGNALIQGMNTFTANGHEATLYLGDANGYIKNIYGTGLTTPNKLGIGTTCIPSDGMLAVNGRLYATSIQVKLTDANGCFPDYVFEKDYNLMPLAEVENYIKVNKHLPEVPSAAEVEKNGIDIASMDATLLKKIEELTLHMIEQQKQIEELQKQLKK